MLARPLNLRRFLTEPARGWDALPFVNLAFIGLLFGLAGSPFVFAPGLTIELPRVRPGLLEGRAASAVLTVKALGGDSQNLLLLFEGERLTLAGLPVKLRQFLHDHPSPHPVLLVKADRQVRADHLFALCDAALTAGFGGLHLAAEVENPLPAMIRSYDPGQPSSSGELK